MAHKHQVKRKISSIGKRNLLLLSVAVLGLFALGGPVLAQTFVEPSTPLGGTTAAPLNSSGTSQRKVGSLLIGPNGAALSKLCLNSATESSNPAECITSWSQLQGAYVVLQTGAVPPEAAAQVGYARVKGSATQGYSIIAEAANISNAAAVFATDGGNSTNFAGYFNGRLYIGDGTGTSTKQLCLNATDTDLSDGKGCLSNWSSISSIVPVGNFVLLQATPGPATNQAGGEALTGAGAFGQVVLGVPPAGTPIGRACGDGICSGNSTTPAETNLSCSVDCP